MYKSKLKMKTKLNRTSRCVYTKILFVLTLFNLIVPDSKYHNEVVIKSDEFQNRSEFVSEARGNGA